MFPKEFLTYDDVLLQPQYSELESRAEADTTTKIGELELQVPIISANMDTITGYCMAEEMGRVGGAGILHRFQDPEQVLNFLHLLSKAGVPAIPSIGVQESDRALATKYRGATKAICLDIAHGHSKAAGRMVDFLRNTLGYSTVIAGNVATKQGARFLMDHGANVVKVGIGPGSVCTTRSVTGHGVPQLSAILDICESVDVSVIADGGLKSSGDIVKALAAGADAVMTGSLFAGCPETPGDGEYRGMASPEAQIGFRGRISNRAAEGVAVNVARKPPVEVVMAELAGGIRSGMSYSGARTLSELRSKAVFIKVSSHTIIENGVRRP